MNLQTINIIDIMSEERKTIYLCLAHMSENGMEQKYVKEAFDTNWVVPMVRYKLHVVCQH